MTEIPGRISVIAALIAFLNMTQEDLQNSIVEYQIPLDVEPTRVRNNHALTTSSGGRIIVDKALFSLWNEAGGHNLKAITSSLKTPFSNPEHVHAALVCLAEAGLLNRKGESLELETLVEGGEGSVSVVLVSYNSRTWLERCMPSLYAQTTPPFEIILVDNASTDGSADWVSTNHPEVKLKRLDKLQSLASALNLGISFASGDYYLLLNPDVVLDPNAIANLLASAQRDRNCAAVAAKLRFIWAPKFLNGLGNYVGAFSWGADSALGHLDLGQFDAWDEAPSACFATALIPAGAWKTVGAIDEGFPLYYEDTEWCYRARLFGFSIRAAPQAISYHAFSGRVPTGEEIDLTNTKRRHVVYGRLRFVAKLLSSKYLLRFLFNYLIEDILRAGLAFISGRWRILPAYFYAWNDFRKSIPSLKKERREIQRRRRQSDAELFALQRTVPIPFLRHGLPQLTWDLIRNHYYPLLASGQTQSFPEYSDFPRDGNAEMPVINIQPTWKRAALIWRQEGLGALVYRVGKALQWRLLQP